MMFRDAHKVNIYLDESNKITNYISLPCTSITILETLAFLGGSRVGIVVLLPSG
jgi:hypothetical protein